MRRVCEKGSYARLYEIAVKAPAQAFPNVGQPKVTQDMLEDAVGSGWAEATAGVHARVNWPQQCLARASYVVGTASPWSPKPKPGYKTCAPSAHTQQVVVEECLLQWSGGHDAAALAV